MDEQQPDAKRDKETAITRAWRAGGPLTPAERKEAKALFIEALRRDPTISFACEYAGIVRATVYRWREQDSKFAGKWEDAVERSKDVARSSIYTRGILGWDEKVVSAGQVVYEYEPVVDVEGHQRYEEGTGKPIMYGGKPLLVRKYSDTLAMGYAKANLPEYKDKPQVNINAQLNDLAEKAKQDLLADLLDEDKKQAHSAEPNT